MDQGDGFDRRRLIDSTLRIHPRGKGVLRSGSRYQYPSLSCALIDLVSGVILGSNPELTDYGRDILARISYVMENDMVYR